MVASPLPPIATKAVAWPIAITRPLTTSPTSIFFRCPSTASLAANNAAKSSSGSFSAMVTLLL